MKHNWALIAAVLAVLAVPFAIALFEDATTDSEPELGPYDDPAGEIVPEEPEPETADDLVEFDRSEPVDVSFLDDLTDGKPGLGPELERVAALGRVPDPPAGFFRIEGPVPAVVEGDPGVSDGPVRSVTFRFPPEPKIRVLLRRKWGSPEVAGFSGAVWLDPDTGVRAALIEQPRSWRLMLSGYQPMERMLERRPDGSFALEPASLLGSTAVPSGERVTREPLRDSDAELFTIHVDPPPASARPSTAINLVREGGRIVNSSIHLDLSLDPTAPDAARSLLEAELGGFTSRRIGEAVEIRPEGDSRFGAYVYTDRLVIDRRL